MVLLLPGVSTSGNVGFGDMSLGPGESERMGSFLEDDGVEDGPEVAIRKYPPRFGRKIVRAGTAFFANSMMQYKKLVIIGKCHKIIVQLNLRLISCR